jgi:hypothetical protein
MCNTLLPPPVFAARRLADDRWLLFAPARLCGFEDDQPGSKMINLPDGDNLIIFRTFSKREVVKNLVS